jgi:hypothetical protein
MVPVNEEAEDMLLSIKHGSDVLGEFKGARNLKQLHMYWALMRVLVDHDVFPSKDAASDMVKIACGHVDIRIVPDTGEAIMVPKSIAFQSMTQVDFRTFLDTAIKQITSRWMIETDDNELLAEVYAIIDPPTAIGKRVA